MTKKKQAAVRKLVEKFGGVRKMARSLRRAPSTVSRWNTQGRIPQENWARVSKVAKSKGITTGGWQ